MTGPKLKACPFCGGNALPPKNDHARMWVIRCHRCNAEVWEKNDGHHASDFIPMIAFAWNRRSDLPATDAQALANPKVRALVEAAAGYRRAIDAFDGTGGMSDKIARVQSWQAALDTAIAALEKDRE